MILLVGGVIIGMMYGTQQGSQVTSLLTSSFKVVLALFLLEMGLVVRKLCAHFLGSIGDSLHLLLLLRYF